jgi:hypothetical protein
VAKEVAKGVVKEVEVMEVAENMEAAKVVAMVEVGRGAGALSAFHML